MVIGTTQNSFSSSFTKSRDHPFTLQDLLVPRSKLRCRLPCFLAHEISVLRPTLNLPVVAQVWTNLAKFALRLCYNTSQLHQRSTLVWDTSKYVCGHIQTSAQSLNEPSFPTYIVSHATPNVSRKFSKYGQKQTFTLENRLQSVLLGHEQIKYLSIKEYPALEFNENQICGHGGLEESRIC